MESSSALSRGLGTKMTINNDPAVLAGLTALKAKNPELSEIIDLHHDLLEAQMQARIAPIRLAYDQDEITTCIRRGKPLLPSLKIDLDWEAFSQLYEQICLLVARHQPNLTTEIEILQKLWIDDPEGLKTQVMRCLGVMDADAGPLIDEASQSQEELHAFVLHHALRPFLQGYAVTYLPAVEQKLWQRGRCPICGGEPDLSFLNHESGSRYLICSRCDSQWLFPRIKCPFCGSQDSDKLTYYPIEDQKYRLYICQNCQRYIKAIDMRTGGHQVLFPVERIATAAMDVAAGEAGFH
jgi:FdhE protein